MYPHHFMHDEAKTKQSSSSATTPDYAVPPYMQGAHEEQFGEDDDAAVKASIVVHPLFEQLLTTHVACLRVSTPQEQQHIIDSELASQHHGKAEYLALLSQLQSSSNPAEDEELTHFMVNYIILLQTFKEELFHHLRTQASEAIIACQEIEQALFNLSGVSSSSSSLDMIQEEKQYSVDENVDHHGIGCLDINAFSPYKSQKTLREYLQRELKHDLKKDYQSKLKEVHDHIMHKKGTGKLPEDITDLLKDWWLSHATWPYPTEEEKVQLMEETGLELKQINNWFTNQRKRKWKAKTNNCEAWRNNMDTPDYFESNKKGYLLKEY